jgi:beta-phosphoglucomutase-like phosphatase (HAD superfamily)
MRGIIFDFDGVIADSEALANTVLAEAVSAHGLPTTLEDALTRYMGKRWPEVMTAIEEGIGNKLPHDFSDDLKSATLARFRRELREVSGAKAFVRRFSNLPLSIASSSSIDRLRLCLNILQLEAEFETHVFSGDMVERGKPYPDLFLLAASHMAIPPANCIVIEDSVGGVHAGVTAGMAVIGLCAGSHLRQGHERKLADAGAHYTASTWADATEIVAKLTSGAR